MVTLLGAAMAIQRDNGIAAKDAANIYVADLLTGSLDTVAVATGVRTAGLAFAGGPSDQGGGLVNTGTTLYVGSSSGKAVYAVTLGASASMTLVANIPDVQKLRGLCLTPPSF
jgi:hypothetical protein